MKSPLKIGFSSCFFHADPARSLFKGKTLLYLEQSLAHWVLSEGALVYLIPSVPSSGTLGLTDLVAAVDGVVLQGGSDVSPRNYNEQPLKPEWSGDFVRDQYEKALVQECLAMRKPIFGICRGAQLLNVALGGSLYQDIGTQVERSRVHRNWEVYDQIYHQIRIEPGSGLQKLYPNQKSGKVNTVHHQAIKELAKTLRAEAISEEDGIIEAVRYTGDSYAVALQWHPEFHDPKDATLLDARPILREFLSEARKSGGK